VGDRVGQLREAPSETGLKGMKGKQHFNPSILLSLPIFYVFWLIFVGTFAYHELLIGIVGALLATVGLFIINAYYPAKFLPTLRELLLVWRIPWHLISGTSEIVAVAFKDLVGLEHAKSLFRVAQFSTGKEDVGHATGRRVLAVVYTTIAPDVIVLGINPGNGTLLFHQMKRSSVPQIAKDLGARA
jgi:multisubunit Na+/H+ antiporter MnhE subunit